MIQKILLFQVTFLNNISLFCYPLFVNLNIFRYSSAFNYPWKSTRLKFIPNLSGIFQFILISVSEPIRIITNWSEKRFVPRLIKTVKNPLDLIQLIPRHQSEWIRTNPKTSFQSGEELNPSRSPPHFHLTPQTP